MHSDASFCIWANRVFSRALPKAVISCGKMVLPDRIELSTSPLPMECSTTELRQHAPDRESAKKAPTRRADPCHKAPIGASASRRRCHQKRLQSAGTPAACFKQAQLRADPVPNFLAQRRRRLDRRTMTSNSTISAAGMPVSDFRPSAWTPADMTLCPATHSNGSTMKDDKDKREGQTGRPAKSQKI